MKRMFLTLLLGGMTLSAVAGPAEVTDEARLLRFPATNGTDVVFSYAGDLFTAPLSGGEARRLTSHIGYEMFAHYSPDGKTIAFTGEYDGNREVYIIPAGGGEPVRLTYTATNGRDDLGDRMGPNNIVMGWTPDGKNIIFRNRTGDGFSGKLWTVSVNGGMPKEIPLPEGGFCSYSPDGKKLAYNRVMREFRTWKYYRGGMADEIWVYDGRKVEKITDNTAQDIFPMWVGDEIYFASDRDMTMNLFVYNTKTKATAKVTSFDDYDVKFPSTNGKLIVFEKGGYLYKLDPATKATERIHITLGSDLVYARAERMNVGKKGRSSFSLSPDGKRMAITARGELFDVPVGKGITRNITKTPGSNERSADWSPDGKYIAFIGDGTGETEVYLYDVAAGGEPVQVTKDNDTYIRDLQWSPDSKHILYTDRKNRIVEVDPFAKTKRTVLQCPEQELRDVEYSPDSKWLTYSRPAPNKMSVVYVYNLASAKEYPVTEKWYDSSSPKFSSDGKYLIFTSDRDFRPIYSWIEWNFAYTDRSGVYMTMLAAGTPSPLLPTDSESVNISEDKKDEAAPAEAAKDKKAAKASKDAGNAASGKKTVDVKIDINGLVDRTIKLPVGGSRSYFSDGKKLWYRDGRGTQVLDFETGKSEQCSEGMIFYRPGDKKALSTAKGKWTAVSFPSAKVGGGEAITLTICTRQWITPRSGLRSSTRSGERSATATILRICTTATGRPSRRSMRLSCLMSRPVLTSIT